MSTPLRIRAATAADILILTELIAQLNFAEGNPFSVAPEALQQALFGSDEKVQMRALVGERGEGVVSLALYYWGYDTVSATYGYHLADMVVAEHARRKSIGRQLYAALAKQLLEEGGQWISLTVLKRNDAAQKYYASMGMHKVEVDFFAIGPQALNKLL